MINVANKTVNSGGVSVLGLLGVAFIVLKLTGYITWSWWLVLLPLYLGIAILSVAALIGLLFALVITLLERRR